MPRERILDLEEYGISKKRYQELKWFCLQYEDKKRELAEVLHSTPLMEPGMPRGYGAGDPTMRRAVMLNNLLTDCELIEQTAVEIDRKSYQFLIQYVTSRRTPEAVDYPLNRNDAYRMRRAFFVRLNEKMLQRGT